MTENQHYNPKSAETPDAIPAVSAGQTSIVFAETKVSKNLYPKEKFMSKSNIKTLFSLFLSFTFVFAFFAIGAPAQRRSPMIEIFGKKPKDFTKAPDMKEFQSPANGEFKVSPTFFAATEDDDRCRAIDAWLSSTRYQASKAYRNSYLWENGTLNMDRIGADELQKYATPDFRKLFGKGLSELSEKEIKQIAKSLDKCSHQRWVAFNLETQFKYPERLQGWMTNFNEFEESAKKEKIEAQKRIYREQYQKEAQELGYGVAELLKETDLYSLHAAFLKDGYTDWCSPTEKQAVVGLIFNIDENSPIESDEEYWEGFESEMLPEIKKVCGEVETVYVLNYVNGFYINYDQNRIAEEVNSNSLSDVHSIGVYSANTERGWIKGDKINNLIAGFTQRTQSRVSFKESSTAISDPQTNTIAGLRAVLKARQEKADAEEKIRREKAAIAEKQRIAEEQRQADLRNAQKRSGDRAKAAGVWKFYKKGARETYDFSAYSARKTMSDIYAGDFREYTGGYDSWADATKGVGATFRNADPRNPFGFLGNLLNTTIEVAEARERRNSINLLFYSYHNIYQEVCSNNREMPWTASESWVFYVTRNGVRVEGSEVTGVSIPIRKPFKDAYDNIYGSLGDNENTTPGIPSSYASDFRKLLKDEGCASANVRHFETNLYLAAVWLLPAQELKKP